MGDGGVGELEREKRVWKKRKKKRRKKDGKRLEIGGGVEEKNKKQKWKEGETFQKRIK